MKIYNISPRVAGFALGLFWVLFFQSCSKTNYKQEITAEQRLILNPPSMVEKLWLARHHYDEERRLIVPKVGGSRWGAVQEYTADGNLVYRDWWVRNLKLEDLEPAPSTEIEVVREEDTSLRPPVLGISGIEVEQDGKGPSEEPVRVEQPEASIADPFAGDSSAYDPFAPVPAVEGALPEIRLIPRMQSEAEAMPTTEADPFAPLPSPF